MRALMEPAVVEPPLPPAAEAAAPAPAAAAPPAVPAPAAPAPVAPDPRVADYRLVVRGSLALLGALILAVLIAPLGPRLAKGPDLAKGKPWRASSAYAECHPEQLVCGEGKTAIFFHTRLENQPWVEIDLGAPTTFSTVEVDNRRDGAQDILDRAVPLVIETCNDRVAWKTVAEQKSPFNHWRAKLEPTTARYVRVRSTRTTYLHLEAVRVYP